MKKTKEDVVKYLMTSEGMKRKDAEKAVRAVLAFIADTLKDGDECWLHQFGAFRPRHVEEREWKVPGDDRKVIVLAHTEVKFYASKSLNRYVNGGAEASDV